MGEFTKKAEAFQLADVTRETIDQMESLMTELTSETQARGLDKINRFKDPITIEEKETLEDFDNAFMILINYISHCELILAQQK